MVMVRLPKSSTKGQLKKGIRPPGRPRGPSKVTTAIRERARYLLERPRYLKKLQERLDDGTAGPMEILLHYYGYGKPKTVIEIPEPKGTPMSIMWGVMTKEERAMWFAIAKRFRDQRRVLDAQVVEAEKVEERKAIAP